MNVDERKHLEGIFLASLLESNGRIPEVAASLAPGDLEIYPKVYGDVLKCYATDGRVTLLDLSTDRADVDEFAGLWGDHAQPELLQSVTKKLLEDNQRGRLRRLCQTFIPQADDPEKDIKELTAFFLSEAQKACQERQEEDASMLAAEKSYIEELKRPLRRFSSGIPGMDKLLGGGLALGTYTIGGGYTSTGKSCFGLNLAYEAAKQGRKVAIISFEMNRQSLFSRLLSIHTGIPPADLHGQDLKSAVHDLRGLSIRLFCGGRRTAESIAMLARREKMRYGLDLLIVDYIQQIMPTVSKSASRNEALTAISASLQDISQSQDVALLALSQLNRSGARENRLGLYALRDSGSLEQDGDHVLLLQRDPKDNNLLSLSLAKNRHGRCGEVTCSFDFDSLRIREVK
jgi:replicative DNA helicase